MGSERFTRTGRLLRNGSAAAMALVAVLAGGGATAAAAHRDGTTGQHAGTTPTGTISTVAGGVGGPAKATDVGISPAGLAFGAGRVYATDLGDIRAVNSQNDRLTTPAGTRASGPLGDGGPAAEAGLSKYGIGVAVDHAHNLVIADGTNNRIRVVAASTGIFYGRSMTAGDIYTVAGTGARGYSGNGGPATSAKIYAPIGVTFDHAGNLVLADNGNHRIRVVAASTGAFYGIAMTAGDIYTIGGNGSQHYSSDGGPATNAELNTPWDATADAAGNVLIADYGNNRVRVAAAGTGTLYGKAMTAGHIYTIAGTGTHGFSGDGGPATSAEVYGPTGVTVDATGNLLIADDGNNRIRVVAAGTGTFYGQSMTAGNIYTIAGNGGGGNLGGFSGDGGPATGAELSNPSGVAVSTAGNVLIADLGNDRIRMVSG